MKTRIISLLSILFIMSFSINTFAQDKKDTKKKGKEEVVFDVSMTCENCKKRIEKNIAFEKGVSDMKVDLPSKTVWIEYKADKTDNEKLQAAFEKLGYEATVHQEQSGE